MLQQFQKRLHPVRYRQQIDRCLRWSTWGLILGSTLGCVVLFLRWVGADLGSGLAWLSLFVCAGAAGFAGFLWPSSWEASAREVDSVYGLKDRTLTALDFASRAKQEPLETLQMQDAISRLATVDAKRVIPWQMPRLAPAAVASFALMLVLALLPAETSTAKVATGPIDIVQEQATLLEETLVEELQELAQETNDPELEELAEAMQEAVEELKEPDVDQRDALAKLSEMQGALSAVKQQLNVQQVDAQLKELAEALQVSDATESASQALQESNYDKAAEELEKIDASTMSRKQRDAAKANLAKLGKKLGEGKKGQLSEAVQEMIDGLENDSKSQCKSGFCKAAGVCRKQGLRKKISQCLGCQLNRLSECKGCCQGQCKKPGNSVAKSDKPSNRWGTGASNQPTGEKKTNLNSTRREEELTGIAGEGPSERETLSSAEAQQDATRSYQERYTKYRKQMEEVLDSEPLPLGHRETVRKYFESIRPTNAEAEAIAE